MTSLENIKSLLKSGAISKKEFYILRKRISLIEKGLFTNDFLVNNPLALKELAINAALNFKKWEKDFENIYIDQPDFSDIEEWGKRFSDKNKFNYDVDLI